MIDIVGALAGLVVLAPVFLVVAGLVRWRLGTPVFFAQLRPGLHGKPFRLIKFRTMRDATDGDGRPLCDAARLTRFGRVLRATSLDELPELWNVVKGEMSIVGPRPLLMQYLVRYAPSQARRHEVRPGLTGLAQVSGRNALGWDDKFRLDVWYVDHHNVWVDLRILALTILRVVSRKGVSAAGEATMPEFIGESDERVAGPRDQT